MKKAIAIFLTVISISAVSLLTGCGKSIDDLIIGSWKIVNNLDDGSVLTQIYQFEKNGDCNIYYTVTKGDESKNTSYECTYLIVQDALYISKEGENEDLVYQVKVDESTLTLSTYDISNKETTVLSRIA